MHKRHHTSPSPTLLGTALSIAPASIGCAVGLLMARRLDRSTRQEAATLLFTVGALATVPLAVDLLGKTIKRRRARRLANRTLEGIRGGEQLLVDEVA